MNVLKYFWTFFWTILLVEMTVYVVSSMTGAPFVLETGLILGVVASILIIVVSMIIPNDPVENH
ncbi:YjzD family protein [Rossellomorea vietnamensis]|uniref:YjzD family protein n=1 Tax=Rossellomorea vietnamensis TaxID=218284 RepID=UPI003CF4A568